MQVANVSASRVRSMLEGTYFVDRKAKGESVGEKELRLVMASANALSEHLLLRIRELDTAFTAIKTSDFLNELPTKRLLLQFVEANSIQAIVTNLSGHFSLVRNHEKIALLLKSLAKTDMERGISIIFVATKPFASCFLTA